MEPKKALTKTSPGQLFSGDSVPVSGVYAQKHAGCSVEEQIWARIGDALPPCHRCGKRSEFRIVRPVIHISEDQDFG